MTFDEVLEQVRELLQSKGRVAYRALKRRFDLDDEYLEDLKSELVKAERVAVDEDGEVLVWTGASPVPSSTFHVPSSPPPPPQIADSGLRTPDAGRSDGERRQLTVMFCDVVGSTALSEQLDPEEYREVVRAYQEMCTGVIRRYAGYIAQHLGDGLLVYFGYPTAHEDDAVRAVRAGLEIITALQKRVTSPDQATAGEIPPVPPFSKGGTQQPPLAKGAARSAGGFGSMEGGRKLQVRIGIHTGLVVIGEIGSSEKREILAMGETPNIAARLQGLAEPDTVVISIATQRLVAGLFECQDLGPQTLKGISTPLSVYQVIRESEAQSRFEVAVRKGLTPLVGREHEVGLLQERWEQAKQGAGQVVLLSGEPGIGKSRLVQEFKEQLTHEKVTRIEFRCSPYHQNSALYPIIDHLQRLLQFAREDSLAVKLEKLQHTLSQYRFPRADTALLLAALLSLPHPEGSPPLTMSPQKQKEKLQAALVAWLVEEAERHPVYNTWEDVHWADPSTLEVLNLVVDQAPTARLYVLLTFRPEFMPPWGNRSHLSQMTLSRLGHSQVEAMVERVTGGKSLPSEVVQQIVVKTDGVPLFVEELTKTVVESGLLTAVNDHYELSGPLPPLAIPSTLRDSLMARLDRLATTREITQLGATIGREFSYELLQAVSPLDEVTLQHGLKQLIEVELIYQRGLPPQATYLFKHALIQDTAYQSLLKSTRQQYHRRIGQVLEARFPESVETQPELLAHHYTEASLIVQALPYWQRAGQRASQRSANVEAVSHLSQGLELLKTLPDTAERSQQELSLQIALGAVLIATKGYASPAARQTYARARELCEQLGDTPQLFPVLFGLYTAYLVAGEHKTAHGLAEQLLRMAHRQQAPAFLLAAHTAFGLSSFFLGELAAAREHVEQGIALYEPQKHNPQVSGASQDPGMACRSYAAIALWFLGYPDQALKRIQEALTLARELAHPYSLAFALGWAARVHQWRREGQQTHEQAEAAITLSADQGFPMYVALGTMLRGWALAEQGQREEEIAQIRQGVAGWRATGAELATTYYLALLAEMYGRGGQVGEGLTVVGEALAIVHKNEECYYEAELYRLRGELTLQKFQVSGSKFQDQESPKSEVRSPESEAEECFWKAIEIARRQQAKSLELRAAMSLSRLWQRQGKKEEARKLLAEIYGWFTEGFDTKDLQEAKTLLEELGH